MRRLLITSGAALSILGCAPADGEDGAAHPEEGSPGTRADALGECPPGALDRTFGGAGTGIARLSIKPDDAGGFTALDLDLSGTGILAAGWGVGGLGGSTFKLARLRHDGTPDPSFGGGEVVETQWGASTANYAVARAVGHQRGGLIVAIGGFDNVRSQDIALARYDANGALDTERFAADGKPIIDLGGEEVVLGGLVSPEGQIVATGTRDGKLLAARFTPDGELDTTFGGGKGYFTTERWASSEALSGVLDHNGMLLVAGSAGDGAERDLVVLRLTRDGELDRSFGSGGVAVAGRPEASERAVVVAVTEGGHIVAAGDTGGEAPDFLVARLLPNGAPDPCFGRGGIAVHSITEGADRAEGMALLGRGKILVVGNSRDAGPVAARFTAHGALDPSFGTGGIQPLDIGEFGAVHTVVIDPQGRALLGGGDEGATPGPGTYAVVARMCL